jgi:Holliday junction resolvase
MAKDESKLWQEVKKKITQISFTRLESWASAGVPDLLCYNKNNKFFTIELKVIRGKKLKFSPHQISFHIRHPGKAPRSFSPKTL